MATFATVNLHGGAPDKRRFALLVIDVINAMDFPGSDSLLKMAIPAAKRIASLVARARKAKVPIVYVNDNFGRWKSDFKSHIQHCLETEVPGAPVVRRLLPCEDDYFVLKPKHSGFYSTSLDILLDHLGANTLIRAGFAGNLCVLYTANDAYMRDYQLIVPRDCLASETRRANSHALDQMHRHLKADVRQSSRIKFPKEDSSFGGV